jgi:hypothetical protein
MMSKKLILLTQVFDIQEGVLKSEFLSKNIFQSKLKAILLVQFFFYLSRYPTQESKTL